MEEIYDIGNDEFGGWFDDVGDFVSNSVKVAGKKIGQAGKTIQKAGGAVGSAISKVPVVGAPVKTILDAGYHSIRAPIDFTVDVAKGKNVGKTALGALKTQVQDVKAVAPYAKMVVANVPGIGTGAAAALGTGLALASGQPIDEALKEGVVSAIPGGPAAQAAARAAITGVGAAVRGKKLDVKSMAGDLVGGLPGMSAEAKQALVQGIELTADIASGKKVDTAVAERLLKTGMQQMAPHAQKAFQTGLGLGIAEVQQGFRGAANLRAAGKYAESGIQVAKSLPTVAEARKLAVGGTKGFDIGQGIMNQRARLFDIVATRGGLTNPKDKMGFDMALASRIGMVANGADKKLTTPAQAGRVITLGMQGMRSQTNKKIIMKHVVQNPSSTVGAKTAFTQIAARREAWPIRVVKTLGAAVARIVH